jgi:hypothetical protein
MGDMADFNIEQGEDAWIAHLAGECFGPCPYCAEEDANTEMGLPDGFDWGNK